MGQPPGTYENYSELYDHYTIVNHNYYVRGIMNRVHKFVFGARVIYFAYGELGVEGKFSGEDGLSYYITLEDGKSIRVNKEGPTRLFFRPCTSDEMDRIQEQISLQIEKANAIAADRVQSTLLKDENDLLKQKLRTMAKNTGKLLEEIAELKKQQLN